MLRKVLISIGYVSLTLLVVAVTLALVAYGNGYIYSLKSHSFYQTGLVIINSTPNNLVVASGDKSTKKHTPYRAAFKPGDYAFSIGKDGFVTWQKVLNVVAGEVTLAQYVILVPKNPTVSNLDTRPVVVAQSISKDHRHLAYVVGGADEAVYTLDLGNPKPVKLYTAKTATPTTPAEVLNNVEWSDDASHMLISSNVGGQAVFRLAAASGGEPVNLTDQYRFDFTGIKFSANWRQLYWISPDGLRRLDVDAQTVSAVLADKVSQFWVEGDRVLYVQQTDLGRTLWSLDNRGHHQELIQALAESDMYSVALTSYQGEDELAVVPARTQTGTLYTGIFGNTPVAKTLAKGVTSASFSPDGHLLAFYSPTAIHTYDLERSKLDDKLTLYDVTDQPGNLAALTWFDNYHLLAVRDGRLYWSEYDGANRVDLGPFYGGFPVYSTPDFKSVVGFKADGQSVRVSQLQIKR